MGQFCCKDSNDVAENCHSDTSPLIQPDTVDSNHVATVGHNVHNENARTDDYRHLTDNILKEAENQMVSANLTDIAVLDGAEIEERTRCYQNKIKYCGKNLPYTPLIPRAIGNPNVILTKISLTTTDISFIQNLAKNNTNVLNQILEPDTEELIVNFAAV